MSLLQRGFLLGLVVTVLAVTAGCSGKPGEDEGGVVARINDYELTLKEYESQLMSDRGMSELYHITVEDRHEFLQRLIRKQVLLQEAVRRKLDQREEFVRTIERYWEATLLRDLMAMAAEDIHRRVTITEEQIRERYEAMKKVTPDLPEFEIMRESIGRILLEEERRARLEAWIETLYEKADVTVYTELIEP